MRTKTTDEKKSSIEKLDLSARESVYAEKTFDNKPCRVRLGRASRKALAFRRDTDRVRQEGFLVVKRQIGINRANESDLTLYIYLEKYYT